MSYIVTETPSGPIELKFRNSKLYLEFNCKCDDALHICKAACCRYRPEYNVEISENEANDYLTVLDNGVNVLRHENGSCTYLGSDHNCKLGDNKPKSCKEWHCSPNGKGDNIKYYQQGWELSPNLGEKVCGITI